MKITEPTTMITDYFITIETMILSFILLPHINNQLSRFAWTIGIFIVGISALLGGTSHGFKTNLSEKANNFIWKATTFSIGISTTSILIGTIISSIKITIIGQILIISSIIAMFVYLFWMINHDEFKFVVMYYLPIMLLLIVFKVYTFLSFNDPSSIYIILGVVVSLIASIVQVKQISLNKNFNHNDIFHIIQLFANYLFFLSIMEMKDVLLFEL